MNAIFKFFQHSLLKQLLDLMHVYVFSKDKQQLSFRIQTGSRFTSLRSCPVFKQLCPLIVTAAGWRTSMKNNQNKDKDE